MTNTRRRKKSFHRRHTRNRGGVKDSLNAVYREVGKLPLLNKPNTICIQTTFDAAPSTPSAPSAPVPMALPIEDNVVATPPVYKSSGGSGYLSDLVCNKMEELDNMLQLICHNEQPQHIIMCKKGKQPYTESEIKHIIERLETFQIHKDTLGTSREPNTCHIIDLYVNYIVSTPENRHLPLNAQQMSSQKIPVTVTLPGITFYNMTPDFNHEVIGTKFFCMGVYGETDKNDSSIETCTALTPYTIEDTDVTLFDRLYFLGTKRYAQGVQSYISQQMMGLMGSGKQAGTAMALEKIVSNPQAQDVFKKLTKSKGGRRKHTQRRGRASTYSQRKRRGGIFKTVKRLMGKVADKAANYVIKKAIKRALPGMMKNATSTATGLLGDVSLKLAPHLAMGTASTAFGTVQSGTQLVASAAKSPTGVMYSWLMRYGIEKYTAIKPEEHRCVWGNQLQDYIMYKGVHVGLPQQLYYEVQDFRGTHVRHLIYNIKFTVDPMRKVKKQDTDRYDVMTITHDYVPIVLRYEQSLPVTMAENKLKEKTQAASSIMDRFGETMATFGSKKDSNKLDVNGVKENMYKMTNKLLPMQAETEKHTSYVRLPKEEETEMVYKQRAKWMDLNRLAAQNNHLSQETMLHSLYSALHKRRLDLFYASNIIHEFFNDNELGKKMKLILQVLSGFLAMGTAKGALNQTGVGMMLNLFTGGMGANAAAFAAGVNDAQNAIPRICHLVQVFIQGIVPPAYFMFPLVTRKTRDALRKEANFNVVVEEKYKAVGQGTTQKVQDYFMRKMMGQLRTYHVETKIDAHITVGNILDFQKKKKIKDDLLRGPRVLFEQFSHNWLPLLHEDNRDTKCHFMCASNLQKRIQFPCSGPGVVLAFEAGASYRKFDSIRNLLQDAYGKTDSSGKDIFKKARLRAMFFGNTHYASVEYETHVADQILSTWANTDTSKFPQSLFLETNQLSIYLNYTKPPDTYATIIQNEAFQMGGNRRRRRGQSPTDDMFDEFGTTSSPPSPPPTADTEGFNNLPTNIIPEDEKPVPEADPLITESTYYEDKPKESPPPPAQPIQWEQKMYDTRTAMEMEKDLRIQTIALLLRSMRNRFFKSNKSDITLTEFLNTPYNNCFPYTYVVAVVPFEEKCTFQCEPKDIKSNGPYIFTSELNFEGFFKGGLTEFMKKVYLPSIIHFAEIRDHMDSDMKVLSSFFKKIRKMPRPPMLFHDYNAYRYDRVKGDPDDPSAQFKKAFDKYSKYVRSQRDARRQEYDEQERMMLQKRKKMLMARRMYELADEQTRLLNNQFTPGSRPGYVDGFGALQWRPRRRDLRHYRRRPQRHAYAYDVSDGPRDDIDTDRHGPENTVYSNNNAPTDTSSLDEDKSGLTEQAKEDNMVDTIESENTFERIVPDDTPKPVPPESTSNLNDELDSAIASSRRKRPRRNL